jgi:hypothetical protein
MSIHRRLRQAAKNAITALRGRRARKPKGPRKGRRRRLIVRGEGPGIDERLSKVAEKALAGEHIECAWELFRRQHFPGWPHERIAAALGMWSTRTSIRVSFEGRTVRELPVIYVCFGASK